MDSLEFTILRPWWFLLILLPLLFIYIDFGKNYKLQNFIREDIMNYLTPKKNKKKVDPFAEEDSEEITEEQEKAKKQLLKQEQQVLLGKPKLWKKFGWLMFPYCCAVIALAGPAISQERSLFQSDENWVWVLDTSYSMLAEDMHPSRFQRAKISLIELLNASKQHRRISLIAYAGEDYLISPPTDDVSTILFNLQELDPTLMPVPGSEPLKALERAQQILEHDSQTPGNILWITDDVKSEVEAAEVAKLIKDSKYPIYIYAIGTNAGAPVKVNNQILRDKNGNIVMAQTHLDLIQKVAQNSGSKAYYEVSDEAPNLVQIYSYEHPKYMKTNKSKYLHIDIGYWFMLGCIFTVVAFFRNYFFVIAFTVCLGVTSLTYSPKALADDQQDEVPVIQEKKKQNKPIHIDAKTYPNEYGYALYQQGRFDEALNYFTDPRWRGNTLYRLGKYTNALLEYQKLGNDADAKYNIGNCFVQIGGANALKDALLAYDQALSLDPAHADANQNKTIILNYMRKQEESVNRTVTIIDEAGHKVDFQASDILATPEKSESLMKRRLILQSKKKGSVTIPEQVW